MKKSSITFKGLIFNLQYFNVEVKPEGEKERLLSYMRPNTFSCLEFDKARPVVSEFMEMLWNCYHENQELKAILAQVEKETLPIDQKERKAIFEIIRPPHHHMNIKILKQVWGSDWMINYGKLMAKLQPSFIHYHKGTLFRMKKLAPDWERVHNEEGI